MDLRSTPFYRYVVRCGYGLLLSHEETEDIAAALIEKHAGGRSERELLVFLALPLTAHLRQDVKCDLLDCKRAVTRRRSRECTHLNADEISSSGAIPDNRGAADRTERKLLCLALLRRIPLGQSLCIALRYYDQLDANEIAARLGLTPAAVEKRIQRGLKRLRQEWEADEAGTQATISSHRRIEIILKKYREIVRFGSAYSEILNRSGLTLSCDRPDSHSSPT